MSSHCAPTLGHERGGGGRRCCQGAAGVVAAKNNRGGDDGDAWTKLRLGVPLHIVLEIAMDFCGGGSGAIWHWFGIVVRGRRRGGGAITHRGVGLVCAALVDELPT